MPLAQIFTERLVIALRRHLDLSHPVDAAWLLNNLEHRMPRHVPWAGHTYARHGSNHPEGLSDQPCRLRCWPLARPARIPSLGITGPTSRVPQDSGSLRASAEVVGP